MNMETVAVINNVVCQQNGKFISMYGRKKQVYFKSGKMVENHIITGKFRSSKLK